MINGDDFYTYLGDGSGTFTIPPIYSHVEYTGGKIYTWDWNKDGNIDIINSTDTLSKLINILPNSFTLVII